MHFTLDLLKDSERRYEGPVSTRFLVYAGVFSAMAIVLLFVTYAVFVGLTLRGNHERLRRTWAQLQPRYERVTALQETVRLASRTAEEIEAWSRSGESWNRILLHLQREIPASIQIVRLEAKDEVETPARPRRGEPMPDPVRRAQVYLSGRITGPVGEDDVTRFIGALLEPVDAQAPTFRTASLVSMQRDRRETNRVVNLFDLDIAGYPRTLK